MAASFVAGFVLLLAMADYSAGSYCVCNSGVSDSSLQKNIDYACWAGADCSSILQNGPCYNPNTLRDHCSYAVNSYYQRKGQTAGSCDFQGTATVTSNPPSAASGCVYPSSSSGSTPTGGGSTTNTGMTPGIALAPTGSGYTDNSGSTLLESSTSFVLVPFSVVVLTCGIISPIF